MRYSGTWLTPDDEAILEVLDERGPRTAEALAAQASVDFSETFVADRCTELAGRGRLVSFTDGVYRITERGESYLAGELDPAKLTPE